MACPDFADLLVDYADLDENQRKQIDSHLALCPGCQAFQNALTEVDAALTASFSDLETTKHIQQAVFAEIETRTPLRAPSLIPLLLDLAGSIAVFVVALVLLDLFLAASQLNIPTYWAATALFVASAIFIGYRSFADLKN